MLRKLTLFTILTLSISMNGYGQSRPDFLVGEWKSYLPDSIHFEYQRLEKDGSGSKGLGQTIEGKDLIFERHFSFLKIIDWNYKDGKLQIIYEEDLKGDTSTIFEIKQNDEFHFEATGLHLRLDLNPAYANRNNFMRTITYSRADKIKDIYGTNNAPCINHLREKDIVKFKSYDKTFKIARYQGFDDLIPYLVSCYAYEFLPSYNDPPYELKILKKLEDIGFGFGDYSFDLSFYTVGADDATSIVIHYDFEHRDKKNFFDRIRRGELETETIEQDGKTIYLFRNWQKKYAGQVFYDNNIFVGYYTKDPSLEEDLRRCISSFKYK